MTWDEAWAEIQRRWLPDDPERPDERYSGMYRVKFETAQGCYGTLAHALGDAPMVIGEIGVRACYSALAMLLGAPNARYVGIEQDAGQFGGIAGLTARAAPTVLAGFDASIRYADSQGIVALEGEFDLFHIDGDHSYDGCWHDLELAWPRSKFVLVDDYDYIRSVQAATDHWIVTHRLAYPAAQALGDGGFRGSMLIAGGRHPAVVRAALMREGKA